MNRLDNAIGAFLCRKLAIRHDALLGSTFNGRAKADTGKCEALLLSHITPLQGCTWLSEWLATEKAGKHCICPLRLSSRYHMAGPLHRGKGEVGAVLHHIPTNLSLHKPRPPSPRLCASHISRPCLVLGVWDAVVLIAVVHQYA